MKKILCGAIAAAFLLIGTGMARAATIEPGTDSKTLQDVIDGITVGGKSSVVAHGADNDAMADSSYWSISGSGGSVSTFIIEISSLANSNSFGIFDVADPGRRVEIFSGQDSTGEQITISICGDGSVRFGGCGKYGIDSGVIFDGNMFGFYIESDGKLLYSDSSLNDNGNVHMLAFQGTGTDTIQIPGYAAGLWGSNEYIFAWDDMSNGGDRDFNDLVVLVESVNPVNAPAVPEPSSLLLFGSGMVGLGYIGYRKVRK